jgi:hypothetical protein
MEASEEMKREKKPDKQTQTNKTGDARLLRASPVRIKLLKD